MFCRLFQRVTFAWLAFAGFAAASSVAAVNPGAGSEQLYRVSRWTTDQGLPQNRISCLKQTRDGYLWLGTWFGLARFDGVRFMVFDKFNTPELVSDVINALAEDTDGTLWIGTADGLVSYREHRFRRLTTAEGLPDWKVWRLTASPAGGIWLHAGVSVARLESGKFSRSWKLGREVLSLHEGPDGWLSIVMDRAWQTLSPKADEMRTNQIGKLSESFWLAGLPGKEPGALWTGTAEGLRRWEQGAWKEVGQEELGPRAVSFIDEDGASNLWVSVGPGKLYRRDHGHWSLIDLGDHFAPAPATCMEEDREGSIWLGTEQGLIQVQPRRVRAYTTRDGLAGDNVWSVCEGTDGAIWVGTDQGLSRIQNGRVVPLGVDEPLLPYADRCVWPAGEGGVFVAKSGLGILKYRNRFSQWVEAKNLPGPNTAGLYEDRSGHLWTGTESGVAVFEGGQATACYTNWAGRAGYDVRCILEDRSGTFWFGTQGQGLTRLHQGKFGVFTTRDGLSNDRVWSIHEDAEGALWLGTENGLTRYWKGRFFALTRRHGLLENSVNWILEDDWGHLWLSGLRGIYRVKREQLNAVADGRAATVECAAFGTADGMESSETNGENQPAGWKARDGRLWFPTTRGVVVIDPKAIQTNEVPTLPVIEQVKADGEVIFGDGRSNQLAASASPVRLAPGRARVVEFRYTANTFAAPSRARFRYRLAGHEAAWREETPERVAHYTGLLPGGYRFEVTAANQCGVWKAASAVFAFSLAPKFSQTPWFPLSWALALLIGSSALVGWRLRWQRRALQAEQMAAVERERTRIARDLHDDLGASLTGMALELEAAHRRGQAGGGQLATLADEARSLALGVRELAWTTNPRCDNVGSLGVFLGELTERFCAAAGLECKLDLPPADDPRVVPARVRHDLLVVVKESLANATRHARAQSISLQLTASAGQLRLTVRDDGAGLDPARAASGSGLRNLRERMDHAGGTFAVSSAPAGGTTITAMVPLSEPEEN